MAWIIKINGRILNTVDEINSLTDAEIQDVVLVLEGDLFGRNEIIRRLQEGKNPRTKGAEESAIAPVCTKIIKALNPDNLDVIFGFDLFREISGWFDTGTSKPGGDLLEEIARQLFYNFVFGRFTEYNNQQLMPNFRDVFLPWLVQVFQHDNP